MAQPITITPAAWSRVTGAPQIAVRYDMPERCGGPLNACYFTASRGAPRLIGVTPFMAQIQSPASMRAILAHEYGHCVQDTIAPARFKNGNDTIAQKVEIENEADAISGVILGARSAAIKDAFKTMQSTIAAFGHVPAGPNDHGEEADRVAIIAKWAAWARGKTVKAKRAEISALARGEADVNAPPAAV